MAMYLLWFWHCFVVDSYHHFQLPQLDSHQKMEKMMNTDPVNKENEYM